jgi:hypothetical protein
VFSPAGSILILDAKYMASPRDPAAGNAYQVLAAGRVAGVRTVGLVYPTSGVGLRETVSYEPVGSGLPRELVQLEIGLLSFSDRLAVKRLQAQFQAWLRGKLGTLGSSDACRVEPRLQT